MNREELKICALSLPLSPGVYLMKDARNTVIYVGKAKKLKNRVSQYFQDTAAHTLKTRTMVSNVDHFETIVAGSEFEALVLECSLIKHYQPKYNILLKDDKGYPYLRIDLQEPFPQITLANKVGNDGAKYFGPYGTRGRSQQVIDALYHVFRLPLCSRKFPAEIGKGRPCLNLQMKLCDGWCTGLPTVEEYRKRILQAVELLDGKGALLCTQLRQEMELAAEELNFELAAQYRDRLRALEALGQKQFVTAAAAADTDVFGWYEGEAKACLAVLHFVGGDLMDKDYQILPATEDATEAISSLLIQYYLSRNFVPKRILLPKDPEDKELILRLFEENFGKKVQITVPQRGDNKKLVELASQNALEEVQRVTTSAERISGTLKLLQRMLGLEAPPLRIEAYDISNIAGTDIVASMTVFEDGRPKKKDYKHFKIQGLEDQDDYASMRQVLSRRFCHYLDGDKGFDSKPDLLLIDGGVVHAQIVREALEAMGLHIPMVGMVKDHRHRTRALVTPDGQEIGISNQISVFSLVGRIQEETHRFAVTYYRKLRSKRISRSRLDDIPGVGEKRRNALFKHFKTISAISRAEISQLSAVVPMSVAVEIYEHFHSKEKQE